MVFSRIRAIACVLGCAAIAVACGGTSAERPNILFIIADDLGYGDLGSYGGTRIATPRIDRLAAEGVRFTDAHAPAAVCRPSRYAVLGGRYAWRRAPIRDWSLLFAEGEPTIACVLQAAGYHTAAIGKWHLGFGRQPTVDWNAELEPGPLEVGFDYFFGTPRSHNEPPFVFVENHRVVGFDAADPVRIVESRDLPIDFGHGASEGAVAAHAARPLDRIDLILADRAVTWLSRQPKGTPWFLYLAFVAPHSPIRPAPEFAGTSAAGDYGDYLRQLDTAVGTVLDALERDGRLDDTLVVFTSDNGGVYARETLVHGHRCNGELLGQKTDAWEGGHRVPFIARWPGRIPAGTERKELLDLVDTMATIAAVAGVELPDGAAEDSLNQLPALMAPAEAPAVRNEAIHEGVQGFALRVDDWVFLPKRGSAGRTVSVPRLPPFGVPWPRLGMINDDITPAGRPRPGAPPTQLYDLRTDLGQRRNLAAREPERAAVMMRRMRELGIPESGG